MARYLTRRLALFVGIWLGVLTVTFVIARVLPGDPAHLAAGPGADRAAVEQIRSEGGFDRPLIEQYVDYMVNLARLDLGTSLVTKQPVLDEITRRLPASLELIFVSFIVYLALALPLALLAATSRRRGVDTFVRGSAILAFAIPAFVLALWLQYIFYRNLGWLPASGRLSIETIRPPTVTGSYLVDGLLAGRLDIVFDATRHLILPVMALVFGLMAVAIRVARASLRTELRRDYIKVARMKGLPEHVILRRHALRNALIPVLTLVGIQFGYLVGGTLVVETAFAWPGLGFYAFNSIVALDYAPVMGIVIVTTGIFLVTNLIVDLLYPVIDPRIRPWDRPRQS